LESLSGILDAHKLERLQLWVEFKIGVWIVAFFVYSKARYLVLLEEYLILAPVVVKEVFNSFGCLD
jgi:hypothetical protein